MTKRLTVVLILLTGLVLGQAAHAEEPDHLVSIVTSGSNETQAMAMILTTHYLREGGSAQVLLCDEAAELALQESDMGSEVVQPADASPRQMLGGLMEAGVEVQVCAIFLPNRAETEDDLREGITVARPDAIAQTMARPDSKLFNN
ncbi:hypothetical protein HC341_07490 [Aquisalimonas sp. 2447]|uniref:hypothetical protein n=1 Tax=Aquisalimonas sp. 2447 TaxID=2740807 RepID=UPI0014323B4F|nr:hypothetical protein [Aquisalimonas sp. 2447]QIT55069.1 hypothetical protein HC341_07490 [Aquisalimonas sp. 2447]